MAKVVVMSKPNWKSKTWWFNGLVLLLAYTGGLQEIIMALPFKNHWTEWVLKVAVTILVVGNLILRKFSVKPVTVGKDPKPVQVEAS